MLNRIKVAVRYVVVMDSAICELPLSIEVMQTHPNIPGKEGSFYQFAVLIQILLNFKSN